MTFDIGDKVIFKEKTGGGKEEEEEEEGRGEEEKWRREPVANE